MNIQKLDTSAVKTTRSTDRVATSSNSLRVRSDIKAGAIYKPTAQYM